MEQDSSLYKQNNNSFHRAIGRLFIIKVLLGCEPKIGLSNNVILTTEEELEELMVEEENSVFEIFDILITIGTFPKKVTKVEINREEAN